MVGVSGGPDSVCLLHCLLANRKALGIRMHVAHLNHMLREESQQDAQFVVELASRWDLPVTVEQQDVEQYRKHFRLSLEEAARQVRYSFFGRLAREIGATAVAVGHTSDDQVETVLLHFLRGSGLAGLRGMQPRTHYRIPGFNEEIDIVRPLLPVRHSEVEVCCQELGIAPRMDTSNLSMRYKRNRIRYRLLPTLEKYNANIRETVLRMAHILDRDYSFIEKQALEAWETVATETSGAVNIEVSAALRLPPAILYHVLRLAVEKIAGSLAGIELIHLEDMVSALNKPTGTLLTLPHGLLMAVGYGYCTISLGEAPCPLPEIGGQQPLLVPGETLVAGWHVLATIDDERPWVLDEDPWSALLDLDRTGDRLWVRTRRKGDRLKPLGMGKEKRLQDFFVDAKVPNSWRDRVPLVVSDEQIVWIAGWRIDDRVKVTEQTRRALRLRFTRAAESQKNGARGAATG